MDFGVATYGLALLAGTLSTLSPCVLPLIPVLIATAVSAHRWGALALGVGLAASFTVVGLLIATLGASLGLDPDTFRTAGAIILVIFGLVLLVPRLQGIFAWATSRVSASGSTALARIRGGRCRRSISRWLGARGCLESLRRADARCCDDARQSGSRCRANCFTDAHLRPRRSNTPGFARIAIANTNARDPRPAFKCRAIRQTSLWRGHGRDWHSGRHRNG